MVFMTMFASFPVRRLRLLRYFFFLTALCLEFSLIVFAIRIFLSQSATLTSVDLNSVSYITSRESTPEINAGLEEKNTHPVDHSSGSTRIVNDLCIEPVKDESVSQNNKSWSLVAYNQARDSHGDIDRKWAVEYRTERLDNGIMDYPAYFLSGKNMRKVHVLLILFQMLEKTNRLNSSLPSMVYYDIPGENDTGIGKESKDLFENEATPFEDLILHLSVREDMDTFPNKGEKICFRKAVFAQETLYHRLCPNHRLTHYLIRSYNSNFNCGKKSRPAVTFINRKDRLMLNIDKLQAIAKRFGDPQVVTFENLTVSQQLRTAYCTDILVGVHGVGMDWTPFMKYNSSVIEVAWDSKGVANLHTPTYQDCPGIFVHHVDVSGVKENWHAFASYKQMHVEHMTEAQKKTAYETDPGAIWLTADVVVNEEAFAKRLRFITSRVNHHSKS